MYLDQIGIRSNQNKMHSILKLMYTINKLGLPDSCNKIVYYKLTGGQYEGIRKQSKQI